MRIIFTILNIRVVTLLFLRSTSTSFQQWMVDCWLSHKNQDQILRVPGNSISEILTYPRLVNKMLFVETRVSFSKLSVLPQLLTRQKCRDYGVGGLTVLSVRSFVRPKPNAGINARIRLGLEKNLPLPLFTFFFLSAPRQWHLLHTDFIKSPVQTESQSTPPSRRRFPFPFSFSFDFGGGDERGELWRVW